MAKKPKFVDPWEVLADLWAEKYKQIWLELASKQPQDASKVKNKVRPRKPKKKRLKAK